MRCWRWPNALSATACTSARARGSRGPRSNTDLAPPAASLRRLAVSLLVGDLHRARDRRAARRRSRRPDPFAEGADGKAGAPRGQQLLPRVRHPLPPGPAARRRAARPPRLSAPAVFTGTRADPRARPASHRARPSPWRLWPGRWSSSSGCGSSIPMSSTPTGPATRRRRRWRWDVCSASRSVSPAMLTTSSCTTTSCERRSNRRRCRSPSLATTSTGWPST